MKHLLLLSFLLLSASIRGQSIEVGVYGGFAYYDGELAPAELADYWQTFNPAYGLFTRFNMIRWVSLRFQYMHTSLLGDDAISGRKRGLSFETDIDEILLAGEFNIYRLYPFGKEHYIEGYLVGGFGVYKFNPITTFEGEEVELQPLGTEGQGLDRYPSKYDLTQWNLTGGGGLKFRMAERWLLAVELTGRINFFDHLDDVSDTKVRYQDVLEGNGPLAAMLSRPSFDPEKDSMTRPYVRGGQAKDYFFTGGITISYLFGPDISGLGSVKCPRF